MIRIAVDVDAITDVLAAGYTQYQVFTDTSSTGAFGTSDGTGTLVAQQQGYTYVDTDGSTGTYYKVAYWGASPGTSAKSDAIQGGVALYYANSLDIRQELMAGASDDSEIGTYDDDIIWDMCEEASRMIDDFKRVDHGAYIASSSTTTYYFGTGAEWQTIAPHVSVSAVAVEETDGTYTSWTENTDFYLWPYDYSARDEPIQALEVVRKAGSSKSVWQHGPRRIRVTGVRGISSTVPPAVQRAARITVSRWYKRAQQGWQDAGASAELGQLIYVRELDPSVAIALRSVWPVKGAGI
jgi:hypothetical protein